MFDLSHISVDDSVGLYLKEMASVPLLNTEEEIDLAQRYEKGKKASRKLKKNDNLSMDQEIELQGLLDDGE